MIFQRKFKMNSITFWLSIATAIIAVLSAIFSQIEKNKEKSEALKKEKELNQKNNQIIESQNQLNDKNNQIIKEQVKLQEFQKELNDLQIRYSDKIMSLQSELNEKQDQLQRKTNEVVTLQEDLINKYKGGNGYGELIFTNISLKECDIVIYNRSSNVLSDIGIQLLELDPTTDINTTKIIQMESVFDLNKVVLSVHVPNVLIGSAAPLTRYQFKYFHDEKRFNIFMNQRNGKFKQQFILRLKNGVWLGASRILDVNGKEVLAGNVKLMDMMAKRCLLKSQMVFLPERKQIKVYGINKFASEGRFFFLINTFLLNKLIHYIFLNYRYNVSVFH